jgi:hypothetical protein
MDGDIRHKSNVLRAQDIIPSSGSRSEQDNSLDSAIPRFDLATEIMAQQRKLTSSRRKRPENKERTTKVEIQPKPSGVFTGAFSLPSAVHTSVITEIVKQDIQKMLLTHKSPHA